jgi:hypothetical protein
MQQPPETYMILFGQKNLKNISYSPSAVTGTVKLLFIRDGIQACDYSFYFPYFLIQLQDCFCLIICLNSKHQANARLIYISKSCTWNRVVGKSDATIALGIAFNNR